jgi:hypothetical protein
MAFGVITAEACGTASARDAAEMAAVARIEVKMRIGLQS